MASFRLRKETGMSGKEYLEGVFGLRGKTILVSGPASTATKKGYAAALSTGTTKSGVVAPTRSMAVAFAQYIRTNAISPGHLLTELTQVTWDHPTPRIVATESDCYAPVRKTGGVGGNVRHAGFRCVQLYDPTGLSCGRRLPVRRFSLGVWFSIENPERGALFLLIFM